jgi:undecaprenyl diphosphate synthase
MDLFGLALKQQVKRLHKNNIQLRIIGDISKFSASLQKQIAQAQELTADNTGLIINIAANYGGRWDVTQAVQKIAQAIKNDQLMLDDVTEDLIGSYLTTSDLPEPDLFIRTGGEQRVSNFLLWQLAYAEMYFTDILWPDFDGDELDKAVNSFAQRERRFGKTSEQLKEQSGNA